MQQFPTMSPTIMAFSWWWVIIGVVIWTAAIGFFWFNFMTDKALKRREAKVKEKRARRREKRVKVIKSAVQDSLIVARLQREAAVAAAARVETASDAQDAERAAEAAAAAAENAEDAAIAATAAAKAVMSKAGRERHAKTGRHFGMGAEQDAAAARAAADRAGALARAKGTRV